MLTIRNFSKKYSERLILSVPEIDFDSGVHWIQGENGSGKSTFFRAISGLCPFEGSIVLNGTLTYQKDQREYLQRLTYSEAEPLFPGFLTPRDVLNFVGNARQSSTDEIQFYCNLFGINEYYLSQFQTCSSGMIKKLSLALSFLGKPDVIILDEPLITLDANAQRTLLGLMHNKLHQENTLFLISSHQWMPEQEFRPHAYEIKNKNLIKI